MRTVGSDGNVRDEEPDDVRFLAGNADELPSVYQRMRHDFPPDELKSVERFDQLLRGGHYKLWLAHSAQQKSPVGYALVFEPETPHVLWLDYMAIDERLRGLGYGAWLFNAVLQTGKADNLGVLLEVEFATSGDPEEHVTQERRIAFYRRLGAVELRVPYLFPASEPPLRMHLYFRPSCDVTMLTGGQLRGAIEAAYHYIHADVPHRHAVLTQFVGAIGDQQF